jgi:hypothetical protein
MGWDYETFSVKDFDPGIWIRFLCVVASMKNVEMMALGRCRSGSFGVLMT